MGKTSIEWTRGDDGSEGATWNPIRGCSVVSAGCKNCYAMIVAARFSGKDPRDGHQLPYYDLAYRNSSGAHWTGEIRFVEEHLEDPLRWKKPRRIFVNSMSDLFHESVPDEWIDLIFAVMLLASHHTYQILTKRPERMQRYFANLKIRHEAWSKARKLFTYKPAIAWWIEGHYPTHTPHIWLGVSVEDQKNADERIPLLLQTPAAVRFVSYEPALGPVNFGDYLSQNGKAFSRAGYTDSLSWIIIGGESGAGARPFDIQWARTVIDQCKQAKVACFVKQLGSNPFTSFRNAAVAIKLKDKKGGDPSEWLEGLNVREFPCQ